MEPRMRQDLEEFRRVCDQLIDYTWQHGGLTDEEWEGIACIVQFAQQVERTARPYGDLDNLAASLAFSTLPATFD